jgi:hypothetical protein
MVTVSKPPLKMRNMKMTSNFHRTLFLSFECQSDHGKPTCLIGWKQFGKLYLSGLSNKKCMKK